MEDQRELNILFIQWLKESLEVLKDQSQKEEECFNLYIEAIDDLMKKDLEKEWTKDEIYKILDKNYRKKLKKKLPFPFSEKYVEDSLKKGIEREKFIIKDEKYSLNNLNIIKTTPEKLGILSLPSITKPKEKPKETQVFTSLPNLFKTKPTSTPEKESPESSPIKEIESPTKIKTLKSWLVNTETKETMQEEIIDFPIKKRRGRRPKEQKMIRGIGNAILEIIVKETKDSYHLDDIINELNNNYKGRICHTLTKKPYESFNTRNVSRSLRWLAEKQNFVSLKLN